VVWPPADAFTEKRHYFLTYLVLSWKIEMLEQLKIAETAAQSSMRHRLQVAYT
jgi:hypothetical protein